MLNSLPNSYREYDVNKRNVRWINPQKKYISTDKNEWQLTNVNIPLPLDSFLVFTMLARWGLDILLTARWSFLGEVK